MEVTDMLSLLFVILVVLHAVSSQTDYLRKEHSLSKPYSDNLWDMSGSAMMTSNFVRLTANMQSQSGAIWNRYPVTSRDWELHVQFKVHGNKGDLYGDGFAIWYTKDRMIPGDVFGNVNPFKGMGIFLDTYSNHNGPHQHGHPYVSAMVNNGTLHYDHDSDGTHQQLDGCEAQFRNVHHDTFISIRYAEDKLRVSMDIDKKGEWKTCFTSDLVKLPTGYFVGLSATTGELSDTHDILSVRFYELEVTRPAEYGDASLIEPSASVFEPPRDHVEDDKDAAFYSHYLTGWRLLALLLLLGVGIGVVVYVSMMVMGDRAGARSKRFY